MKSLMVSGSRISDDATAWRSSHDVQYMGRKKMGRKEIYIPAELDDSKGVSSTKTIVSV